MLGHGILCKTNPNSDIGRYSYFEGLARDLAGPISAQEQALDKTRRFTGLLQRMDDAREGKAYFHDPSHKGDKGKGKGKQMRIADRWTKGLVAAGLDVGPYTDRRRGPEI